MHALRRLTWNLVSRSQRKHCVQAFLRGRARCKSTTVERPPSDRLAQISIPTGILGQPTCNTHPHLIQPGQLTCGITQLEFLERRDILMSRLVAEVENESTNHIVVIPAACKQYMSEKIPYVFRQNSDFFYFTGCLEPTAVLVMYKPAQIATYRSIMFVNEKDSHAELWEGPRTGCSAAVGLFAVNEARPVETFPAFINKITATKPSVMWYQKQNPVNTELHSNVCRVLGHAPNVSLGDPQRAIHFMRVLKSPAEIELMKETCYIGAQSVNMAMACTQPGMSEHNLNAILEFSCKQTGAEQLAFPPVVAGGARATHIHYVANNQLLAGHEMVLVDTGCQRWLYNSDISRTWPVSGKFEPYHRIMYELVLSVQKRLITLLGEQRPPLDQLFDQMCRLLGTQLQQEGILPRDLDGNELVARAYRLCPHHVSHYLGLDVHDASLVRRNIPVQSGMVVTVEPGIYIRPDDKSVPEEFRGIGIRIEDDVLVTEGEPLVLTESCVKEPDDIESIVGKHTLAM